VLRRALRLVYLMMPAYAANMAPPFLAHWRGWNPPISRTWLGSHKTVLGFAAGLGAALATTFVQSRLGWRGGMVAYDDWPVLGLLFGVGAMGGDCVKSFVKRRLGIRPGRPWIPFDQLDFLVGALLLIWPRVALTWSDVAIVLLLSVAGDIVVNHVSYALGVRATRW
jgi:CDP-2,3-bis-(O-geranylgeranyl)-sn-glycerol synthase